MRNQRIGDSIDALTASHLIQQLQERKAVTPGEAALMNAAVSDQSLSLPITVAHQQSAAPEEADHP